MKANELREKSVDDLNKELLELTREKFNLRMQTATGQMNRTHPVSYTHLTLPTKRIV